MINVKLSAKYTDVGSFANQKLLGLTSIKSVLFPLKKSLTANFKTFIMFIKSFSGDVGEMEKFDL